MSDENARGDLTVTLEDDQRPRIVRIAFGGANVDLAAIHAQTLGSLLLKLGAVAADRNNHDAGGVEISGSRLII